MIVSSNEEFELNKYYECPFWTNSPIFRYENDKQRFYVIRKATKREYIKDCVESGCRLILIECGKFFYEISVD